MSEHPRPSELTAWLAMAIESSDDAIVTKSLDGTIRTWNRGAAALFGYTPDEAIGKPIFLIVPENRHAEEEDVLARLRRGERIDHFETERQARDGRLVPVSLTVSPVRDDRGHIIGALNVARDVSVRAQRDELRARLAAIVESSDDAIVSKTLDGVITSWNLGAERLFGYTAAEAIGRRIFLIIPEDRREEEEDVLARLRRGERVDHFETVRLTKDGRRIPISLTVSPLRDDRGAIIGASKVARDISDRVRRERVLLLTRLVVAQEDERRHMARELHDQLGQQLTALRLSLEMLKSESADRSGFRTQIETLEALTRQLDQDVAFRVRGLRSTALERHGLAAALREYVDSWSRHFGLAVNMHIGPSAEGRLPAEIETTIYRLLQEGLNNVVKHARADHVDIVFERSPESVSLIIEDNGVGFDPSRVPDGDVHGLGLIGMRERAALVGADFEIETSPGQGTTVFVRVPVSALDMQQT